jgi:UDP-N-acetylglucosamine transferase subunit ALG13
VSHVTVVVSVGTYHLPYDRLADWMASWNRGSREVRIVLQHGVGRPLPGAENHEMLPPEALLALYHDADIVVMQGGAGGVMDARAAGRVPIVVPRLPELGEVVDRHQIAFATQLSELGVVHLCLSEEALHRSLDDALAGRLPTRVAQPLPTPGANNAMALLASSTHRISTATTVHRLWRSLVGPSRLGGLARRRSH